ncbi:class I SAM-dependent methyltransferase [Ectothiorhodospiraceae bacterium 2226]|nr:class I SAM-dependent methyltransferase [Ectothiorhodospiraceae bacterium 2226]
MTPAAYEAWYHTPRGRWIAQREADLVSALLRPRAPCTVLDVGCGTGHFSRRFSAWPAEATGLDPDRASLLFARAQGGDVHYVCGDARALPFADRRFTYVTAMTSLCFVEPPERAVGELWRVADRAVVLGLLNRHSLLYRRRAGRGGYRGARWDTVREVRAWARTLNPRPRVSVRSAVFLAGGGGIARWIETVLPQRLPFGGFLAVLLQR